MASKDLEREYLWRFRDSRPDLSLAEVEDHESPDFLVRRADRVIGIEVTRYSPPPKQGFVAEEQESLRARVMSRGRELYEARGGAPLHVSALFNDHRPVQRSRVDGLAQELAGFLMRASAGVPVYGAVPFIAVDKYPALAEIGHITAMVVPGPDCGLWYAGEGGWVRDAVAEDFSRLLAKKDRRVHAYRANCDEAWLLAVLDTLPGGEYVQAPTGKTALCLSSAFDRVFVLERVTSRVVELTLNRGA